MCAAGAISSTLTPEIFISSACRGASCRRYDEYGAPLGTGALFANTPVRHAACWMTLTPPAIGLDRTH
jgi:hypothetical protein